ncbi:Imm1 family immunity protein [Sorangium sp. So ce296]|uniref:Imm1 family immunity protein n=1 Tax=Sorangium sp. So ce296 TaxID=3133296 RepID=UPI003F63D75D
MNANFCDYEDPSNPLNGRRLAPTEILEALRSLQGREPFICSLETDSGTLLVGVGRELGCVQFTPANGGPPYLMATTGSTVKDNEFVEFLSGGTPSPISRRHCLPWQLVESAVADFLDQGVVPQNLHWEEV